MKIVSSFNRAMFPGQIGNNANKTLSNTFRQYFTKIPIEKYYNVALPEQLQHSLHKADELKNTLYKLHSHTNGNLQNVIQNKLRALWTYNSNAIEGSSLTLGETIFFLQEGITINGKPFKDFLAAHNHSHAIDYVLEAVQNKLPINAHLIRSMHALILQGVNTIPGIDTMERHIPFTTAPGQYKKTPNYVLQQDGTIYNYVEPNDVENEIYDMFQWFENNKNILHPIILAAVLHYNFVRIHPFDDGNGRLARILMNVILMNHKFPPTIVKVKDRQKYLENLNVADKGNLSPFTQFIADSTITTLNIVLEETNKYLDSKKQTVV